MPLVTDNNEPKPTGRRSNDNQRLQADGKELRVVICAALVQAGLHRPRFNGMRYSSHGSVYFE